MATDDIRDHGGTGERPPNDDPAIRAAVDGCHDGGVGTIVVPAGGYRSGSTELPFPLELHVERGRTLTATADHTARLEAVHVRRRDGGEECHPRPFEPWPLPR